MMNLFSVKQIYFSILNIIWEGSISETNWLIKSQVISSCFYKMDKRQDFCQGLYIDTPQIPYCQDPFISVLLFCVSP